MTVNGSHNITEQTTYAYGVVDNTTNWEFVTAITTNPSFTDAVIVEDLSVSTLPLLSSVDLTPLKATTGVNDLFGNGVNRQGSEPDHRQDFSKDIRGNTRPTNSVDVGPFQSVRPLMKVWDGSAFVEVNAVQVYDGSSFVDVSAIQRYDGSSFIDI